MHHNPNTGLNVGPPLPASAYQSVQGYDAFNPGTNFHDLTNPTHRNGIVFFPGSAPLYKNDGTGKKVLIGGLGISGDGVDQDDFVTNAGAAGFLPPNAIRATSIKFRGTFLPFFKYPRHPTL